MIVLVDLMIVAFFLGMAVLSFYRAYKLIQKKKENKDNDDNN